MGGAEFAPADEFHVRKLLTKFRFENGKNLVAEEKIVPKLRDGLPIERVEPLGERALRLLSFPAGPHDFIEPIAAGFLRHDKLLATIPLRSALPEDSAPPPGAQCT